MFTNELFINVLAITGLLGGVRLGYLKLNLGGWVDRGVGGWVDGGVDRWMGYRMHTDKLVHC